MQLPPEIRRIFLARSLRGMGDGCAAVLVPVYLLQLGFGPGEIGAISSVMLLGAALLLILIGIAGHAVSLRTSLLVTSGLVVLTGINFATFETFGALVVAALIGTINPSGGDNNVFRPLEQTLIARVVQQNRQTAAFAYYAFLGLVVAGIGAYLAGLPDWLAGFADRTTVARAMFLGYAGLGLASLIIYLRLDRELPNGGLSRPQPLRASRRRVAWLTALLTLDALGGGFLLNSVMVLWLSERFGMTAGAAGLIFFTTAVAAAVSLLAAPHVAGRLGLVRAIVSTQALANVFVLAAAFAPTLELAATFLVLRSLTTQMDVPARTSYLMAIVTPDERAAAAAFAAVPFLLAAACGPVLAGFLIQMSDFKQSEVGWPLVIGAGLKLIYDLLFYCLADRIASLPRRNEAATPNERALPR
jgi:MFS family permease